MRANIIIIPYACIGFYFPAWSTQYPTTSGGHQGHAVVPPVMPKFHLPGMQLLSIETYSLHDNTQPHTIAWNKFGFKLYIPPGAFHEKTLNITVGVTLSGNFKFPANSTLVSAVYYVEASSKLFRPVTIEMEHCLMSKDEDDFRELSFLVAEVHPGFPHYTFQAVRWGIFSPASSWGSIQVSSFSLFSIISWITDLFKTPPIGYSAQIYQMKVSQIVFNVRLVVTRHLSSCKEVRYIIIMIVIDRSYHHITYYFTCTLDNI